ncbi:hypothetical protein ESCO_001591 [Escovopsis weberi]|uniref:Transcription factor RfeG n=1 Tax=Escovopsis weberi TaxID=150374 RepID=A0A0M8N8R5_ESCWE|nr:hypothetical protein ESCO_001591 [Escovopsis weberi]
MSRPTTRQNEYFVPRDGIDREVISADICRYLGNDALVRPGHYENPQTGQPVQGYYITAYRNLTTAMIEDLKADSARWDRERRAQTARSSSGVQYRYSETHQSRQHHGPTDPPYRDDPYARDSPYDQPRYPGTGAPGYTGAAGTYQPPPQGYAPPSGGAYGPGGGGGPAGVGPGAYQQAQQSPGPQDPRYITPQGGPPMMSQAYQGPDQPYVSTGANMPPRMYPTDPYAGARPGPAGPVPPQPMYASAAPVAPPQAGYPAPAYPYPGQPPAGAPPPYAMQQPQDPFFGRGASPSSNGYPAYPPTSDLKPASDFVASPDSSPGPLLGNPGGQPDAPERVKQSPE